MRYHLLLVWSTHVPRYYSFDAPPFLQPSGKAYAVLELGTTTYQTAQVKAGQECSWRKELRRSGEFMVYHLKQMLYVKIFSASHKELGRCAYPIRDIISDEVGPRRFW